MTACILCQAYYVHCVIHIMSLCQLIGRSCLLGDNGRRLHYDRRLM